MLKIALIRQRYASDGGAERFVARAIEALRGDALAITLLSRQWSAGADVRIEVCNPFYVGRWWRDWSFAHCVCQHLQTSNYDLVQSHERISCCDLYRAGDGVHREGLKQLARVRGPFSRLGLQFNPYHRYTLRAERCLFESKQLKAVICNSRMVRDEILGHFRIAPEKLHVIYSGVDLNLFHPDLQRHRQEIRAQYGIPVDAPLFLFVGSGFERKGVGALLSAFARLPATARLLVVGRDKHSARYENQTRSLGLTGRVYFTGPQPDVKPYYGAADLLVLPTLYDPFPNVALEALACGLPVITRTQSGGAELIREGVNGYVRDALDIEGLAEVMRSITVNGVPPAMREQARSTVASMSLDRWRDEMLSLYQKLLPETSQT